ncbi:alpha/beta fold hydrolase [Basilea psittacipulmonis]|uniref:AB hydrolase-1 domain-containing protein n=1 Tax=Basilea psittacipulmonis DSM 24701 TaxID=1072685 RepID=A0A077DDF5_9BURK|nr:alpha/beta hydrolase [Basilea psittacipulmonis]AIL32885.1 hypothetical protein IX83_05740 [Basilea psittacipulmonis DSM 24701]
MSNTAEKLDFFHTEDNSPLFFQQMGEGEAVILIHGSLCDYRYWRTQTPVLSESYRIIVPSLRYYWPNHRNVDLSLNTIVPAFSIAQHAQDILALMDHLNLEKAHILGHSRGGVVALKLAFDHPERVQSLILAEPGLRKDLNHQTWQSEAWSQIQQGNIDAGLQQFINQVSGPHTWEKMVSWFKNMARDNAHTLQWQYQEPFLDIQDKSLQTLTIPTLLLGGSLSPSPFPEILERLATHLPIHEQYTIEHASHGLNLSHAKTFNQHVLTWLTQF